MHSSVLQVHSSHHPHSPMGIMTQAVKLSPHPLSLRPMGTTMAGAKLNPHTISMRPTVTIMVEDISLSPLSLSPMGIIMEEVSRPALTALTVVSQVNLDLHHELDQVNLNQELMPWIATTIGSYNNRQEIKAKGTTLDKRSRVKAVKDRAMVNRSCKAKGTTDIPVDSGVSKSNKVKLV